ncbi:MAG: M48 family metallopeptidase [Lachnospiraceae bacterium]|nr:M48 family metallopeptidase [Candidatus Minthocola equi]
MTKKENPELFELTKKAKKYIPERVAYYAPLVGVSYGRIAIRHQRSRWGSCSAAGNLNFNCLLMLAPPEVIDSVVVHELCHLKVMNHSKKFYDEVLRVMPEYRTAHKWLRLHGRELMTHL